MLQLCSNRGFVPRTYPWDCRPLPGTYFWSLRSEKSRSSRHSGRWIRRRVDMLSRSRSSLILMHGWTQVQSVDQVSRLLNFLAKTVQAGVTDVFQNLQIIQKETTAFAKWSILVKIPCPDAASIAWVGRVLARGLLVVLQQHFTESSGKVDSEPRHPRHRGFRGRRKGRR